MLFRKPQAHESKITTATGLTADWKIENRVRDVNNITLHFYKNDKKINSRCTRIRGEPTWLNVTFRGLALYQCNASDTTRIKSNK